MKQILQSLKTGQVEIAEVAAPVPGRNDLLVKTAVTLVSVGTERMLVEFGKSGWIGKARQQPDKVRDVIRKVRTDGVKPTLDAVLNKLDQPLPLGYCNVGTVAGFGPGVRGFAIGQRVVSNGKHAGMIAVPANLAAAIPDAVSDEEAAFTVIGAIALQGIRLTEPTLGECVVVSGLGLIGLIAVQLLVASGCRVLGLDYSPERLALARQFGAETFDLSAGEPFDAADKFSRGRGIDAVIVAASTTSSDPISHAAQMSRKRGRIVLIGVTGLELSRADFYEKELSFQVSCSYGPGRYDPAYEAGGQDYPAAFVRWTAQRNFEAVLDMMASGHLDMKTLVSHRFPADEAQGAYELIGSGAQSMGIVLDFGATHDADSAAAVPTISTGPAEKSAGRTTFIGAGNYAGSVLIPAFRAAGAKLDTVVSASGVSAFHAARKFGFADSATDAEAAIAGGNADTVVVATQHDSHARLAIAGLAAGRNVFVEKPLALTGEDVDSVEQAWRASGRQLMVGFNRRFSPLTERLTASLRKRGANKAIVMTINAGAIPGGHWTQDPAVGGGRIVGEAVHFIDLARHLAGSAITGFSVAAMDSTSGDSAAIQLSFANGDIASIAYLANGTKAFPKERVEVFSGGAVYRIDNWRKLEVFGDGSTKGMKLWAQNKGQTAMAARFIGAVRGENGPAIAPDEIFEVARVAIAIAAAANG